MVNKEAHPWHLPRPNSLIWHTFNKEEHSTHPAEGAQVWVSFEGGICGPATHSSHGNFSLFSAPGRELAGLRLTEWAYRHWFRATPQCQAGLDEERPQENPYFTSFVGKLDVGGCVREAHVTTAYPMTLSVARELTLHFIKETFPGVNASAEDVLVEGPLLDYV